MLDVANLEGDSGAAGRETLKCVLVVGGYRQIFPMTCDWNTSRETHESEHAEQCMTGGGAFLAASGETTRGGWLISGCTESV